MLLFRPNISHVPFPLPPSTPFPLKRPRYSHWPFAFGARSSSKRPKRRGQSGKSAHRALLGCLRLPVSMMIYVTTKMVQATGGTQKVRGSGLVRGAVAPHTRP